MKETTCGTILMVTMALVACGNESTPAASTPAPVPSAPAASAPPPPPVATADAQPEAAPVKSLASAEGEVPGLQVEVQELKRTEGGTVTLKFAFLNTGGRTQFNVGKIDQIALIDAVGKKKYFVVRDAQDACVCSRNPSIDAGARVSVWAKFPAPPEDVEKISVIVPLFPPLEGIPVSR